MNRIFRKWSTKSVWTDWFVLVAVLFALLGPSLCSLSALREDEVAWKQWKQQSVGRSVKTVRAGEKAVTKGTSKLSGASRSITHIGRQGKKDKSRGKQVESSKFLARQGGGGGGGWGWGWPSSYGGSGGSYDVYTIIAVAAFAALFGALMYELLGGSSRRSFETASLSLPPVSLGLDSEKLPEVMVKIGDWIANSSWFDSITNDSRTLRDITSKMGVRKWFDAFKKDPVEYQCVRKMACETLATSALAEKSLKTSFGNVFLSVFGNFIEHGNELQDIVKQVVGNPKKCDELVTGGYCEENL